MKTRKIITLLMLSVITLTFAQKTSKEEIAKIIKEQSDGVYKGTESATKTVYSDGKEVVSTVYKDVKSLTPKIAQGINEIAKGLKIGAESVWLILVKQQKVWSICFLILTIASLINWFLFYKRYLNNKLTEENFAKGFEDIIGEVENPNYNKYRDGSKQFINGAVGKKEILIPIENKNNNWFIVFHFMACVLLSVFSAYHFGDMLTGFLNPEYGAMKDILFVALKLK